MKTMLPYENASSGERAIAQIQKILAAFGCQSFGHMVDQENGELLVQFRYRERSVSVKASTKGYAAAWLKRHPFNAWTRVSKIEYERKANTIASRAVYSILRDWIKGQVAAIETGVLSFEGAFLGSILLPSGKTVLELAHAQKLLPAPSQERVVSIDKAAR